MNICPKISCTGCGACLNRCPKDAISMVPDEEGFSYPQIDESKCISCGFCRRACPVINPVEKNPKPDCVYAAWAKEDRIRCASSSGGVFSVLAEYVLANGGVVNGVAFDDNLILRHQIIDSESKLSAVRGSKYVQSDIGIIYRTLKEFLDAGKMVLFTSVPCQVAGFKAFLGRRYDNLLTCDILCHGVPSPLAFVEWVMGVAANNGIKKVKGFNSRKLDGWDYQPSLECEDGNKYVMANEECYFHKAFLSGLIDRESCYNCKYIGLSRVGDITLGDFWGIGTLVPFKHNISSGCSLVLLNSDRARKVFRIIEDNMFVVKRYMFECGANQQLIHRIKRPKSRDCIYGDMRSLGAAEFRAKYSRLLEGKGCFAFRIYRFGIRLLKRILCQVIHLLLNLFGA